MQAEIISVGTELLLGDILNTNAHYLARQLATLGFSVYHQSVVGDNPARLAELVRLAKGRSQVVVFTGGLGPTEDDLTKQTVAGEYGDALVEDAEEVERLTAFFKGYGRPMTPNNLKQAMMPQKGGKLANPNGTAPGVWFCQDGHYAFLLPGPPREMRPMFRDEVRPMLEKLQDAVIRSHTLHVFGLGESELETRVAPFLEGGNPTCALYAKTGEVHIRVTARAKSAGEGDALCREMQARLCELLGDIVYTTEDEELEQALVKLLAEKGQTLATAESCTGGLLSERITSVPGASAVFGFGVCTYANAAKQKLLGVQAATLEKHGAVSGQTAGEMARGARRLGSADYGVGITGIAGPDGGTPEKPVGLVYVAAADKNGVYVKRLAMPDRGREYIRWLASMHALDMVRRLAAGLPQRGASYFAGETPADM